MTLTVFVMALTVVVAVALRKVHASLVAHRVTSRMTNAPDTREVAWPTFKFPVSKLKYERQLPVTLDSVARSLYSGSGFLQALREASQLSNCAVCADLVGVVHQVDLGLPIDVALQAWADRVDYPSVRVTVSAMVLALNVGGNQAQAVDSASAAVRRTVNASAIAHTYSTDARVSMWAVVAMPFFVSGPLMILNNGARHFMFGTLFGWIALTVGIGLDAAGLLWIRALTKRAIA